MIPQEISAVHRMSASRQHEGFIQMGRATWKGVNENQNLLPVAISRS